MISLARESRGVTQEDLALRLGVTQGKVSKLEAGLLAASAETVAALSRELRYPPDFFYQTEHRFGLGPAEFYHYRKKKSVSSQALTKHHARIDIKRIHVTRLLDGLDAHHDAQFPQFDVDDFGGDSQEMARAVRATWHMPAGPIRNLTKLVEAAGGVVMHHDFENHRVDAISRFVPPLPPLFFMNSNVGGARYRFSLSHDVCHVVAHRTPTPTMEEEADRFAAEFLMPAAEIRPHLAHLTLQRAATLAAQWRVSLVAIVKRAADLGKLSGPEAERLWMEIGRAGYRRKEPPELDFPVEQPTVMQEMFATYQKKLGYSTKDISRLLILNEDEFAEVYGDARGRLRLIRE